MPRQESHTTPKIVSGRLYTEDELTTGTVVDTPAWFAWLETAYTFYFESRLGTFTAHREQRQRGGHYWVAYRRYQGRLVRAHLGKSDHLTLNYLEETVLRLRTALQLP